eukprot:847442-Rhodomonas_salina.2
MKCLLAPESATHSISSSFSGGTWETMQFACAVGATLRLVFQSLSLAANMRWIVSDVLSCCRVGIAGSCRNKALYLCGVAYCTYAALTMCSMMSNQNRLVKHTVLTKSMSIENTRAWVVSSMVSISELLSLGVCVASSS